MKPRVSVNTHQRTETVIRAAFAPVPSREYPGDTPVYINFGPVALDDEVSLSAEVTIMCKNAYWVCEESAKAQAQEIFDLWAVNELPSLVTGRTT